MLKSLTAQGFCDKIRVGVLSSPIKLFNTPTLIQLVEAGRVELPSESTSTGTSPSADDPFHSLAQAWVVTLLSLVES